MDHPSLFGDFYFGASFGDFCADFGQAFEFGAAFYAGFSNFVGSVSIVFDDSSLSLGGWFDGNGRRRQDRREQQPNGHYCIESVT
jgi:hypothetical protein